MKTLVLWTQLALLVGISFLASGCCVHRSYWKLTRDITGVETPFELLVELPLSDSGKSDYLVNLTFINNTDYDIIVDDPICFGINAYPILVDSSGKRENTKVRFRAGCDGRQSAVERHGRRTFIFPYKISFLYDLTRFRNHFLQFEYYGVIRNLNGKIIFRRTIRSNRIALDS